MPDSSAASPSQASSQGPSQTPPPKTVAAAPAPDASRAMTLFVMIVATLYFGKEVLVPVTLALLLAFILAPLVELLRRIHLGRVPSVLLGVLLALGLVSAVGGVIGTQVAELSKGLPQYAATVEKKVEAVRSYTIGRFSDLAASVGMRAPAPAAATAAAPAPGLAASGRGAVAGGVAAQGTDPLLAQPAAPTAPAPAAAAPAATASAGSSPLDLAYRYLSPILSPLATLGIVFIVAVFALLQREDLRDRLIRLVGSNDLHRTTIAIDDGGRRLSKYFITQLCVNSAFGVVIGTGLFFIGVPNPVLWGILSALLRFVPYVGSFIAAGLPLALAAAVEPGWTMVAWTAALYVVVEGLTGQVLEPLLYGHSTGLSPFSVVVAAIFWSWLWGPVGLILSTPLTLCLVVVGRHVARLQFLDVMLGDRPALTPIESFYQRILAGDADEAQDHAEELLKEQSLSAYYDGVALKALQLAANDSKRGVLGHDQLDRIKGTVKALVHGLDGHGDAWPAPSKKDGAGSDADVRDEDVSNEDAPGGEHPAPHAADPASVPEGHLPASWRMPAAVLCIAGRGPLDEAAADMLAQLLSKHGMNGRVVGHEDVSRDRITRLETSGAVMACISYLDIAGSPAHLRYLIQRLRARLPGGTPILVGLWPTDDTALTDKAMQASVGADYFVSSLAESVTACVDAAGKVEAREAA